MTADEIRAAIRANPAIAALVPDTGAIADALSVGRTRLTQRLVTERGIVSRLGIVAGEQFLAAMEAFAIATLPAGHPMATIQPGFRRVIAWLKTTDGLDVGDPLAQQMLQALAALGVVDSASATAVMDMARVPDPVDEMDVRRALWADDGTLLI